MNGLSWFIYFAGIASGVSGWLCWIGGIAAILGIGYAFCSTIDESDGPFQKPAIWPKKIVILGLIAWFASFMIPPKETFYAIAASEIGEEIVKSPTAGKAVQAVDAWLDKQIRDLNKKPEKESDN